MSMKSAISDGDGPRLIGLPIAIIDRYSQVSIFAHVRLLRAGVRSLGNPIAPGIDLEDSSGAVETPKARSIDCSA